MDHSPDPESIPRHGARLAWKRYEEVIYIQTLGPNRFFHELDPVGSWIWEHCNGKDPISEISREFSIHFSLSKELALGEVRTFIIKLKEMELLVDRNHHE